LLLSVFIFDKYKRMRFTNGLRLKTHANINYKEKNNGRSIE